jgi:sodium/potassium/calcium exchanger 6
MKNLDTASNLNGYPGG